MKTSHAIFQALGFVSISLASPTPEFSELKTALDKRACGVPSWDSTNITNWADAKTDQWFDAWWKQRLGGNGDSTSMVIPHGWPNDFANLFGRMYLNGVSPIPLSLL